MHSNYSSLLFALHGSLRLNCMWYADIIAHFGTNDRLFVDIEESRDVIRLLMGIKTLKTGICVAELWKLISRIFWNFRAKPCDLLLESIKLSMWQREVALLYHVHFKLDCWPENKKNVKICSYGSKYREPFKQNHEKNTLHLSLINSHALVGPFDASTTLSVAPLGKSLKFTKTSLRKSISWNLELRARVFMLRSN